jgi:polyhydroxyalkanoate synthesis regulator protein
LRLDPDIKACSDQYKMLRKLNKLIERINKNQEDKNYNECVKLAKELVNFDTNSFQFMYKGFSYQCSCGSKSSNSKESIKACDEAIKMMPNDSENLYNRGQAYILEEDFELGKTPLNNFKNQITQL